jgi:dTDP-4-amino-4,6-dideoxygalactose transaminase
MAGEDGMPYRVVREFEEAIAEWAGSRYAVAVESCSAAIFLCCVYKAVKEVHIPARTYPSVPCAIIHAGGSVMFHDEQWEGIYELAPYNIWDGALRFQRGMYEGGLHCLSFHARKHLKLGRGGMILVDDLDAMRWLRLARFDGREECDLSQQKEFRVAGWNMYLQPEQAARGLLLFASLKHQDLPDLPFEDQHYPDLSKSEIYRGASVAVCIEAR